MTETTPPLSAKALLEACARKNETMAIPAFLSADELSYMVHAMFQALTATLQQMSEADAAPDAYEDTAALLILELVAAAILDAKDALKADRG
jgi:hypothetical protein